MSSEAADALGLSRAILCNGEIVFPNCVFHFKSRLSDSMVKKLNELENNALMFKTLVEHIRHILKVYYDLARVYKGT